MKTSTCILTALLISSIAMAQSNYGKIPVDISGSSVSVTNRSLVELVNGDGDSVSIDKATHALDIVNHVQSAIHDGDHYYVQG